MQLWMSGEIHKDVADAYRETRKRIESAFNQRFGDTDYGSGIARWAFIAIMLPRGWELPPEIQHYSKRDRVAEFRLHIDFDAFKTGTAHEREVLLCRALRRSLELFPSIGVPDTDVDRLRHDFESLLSEHGWEA